MYVLFLFEYPLDKSSVTSSDCHKDKSSVTSSEYLKDKSFDSTYRPLKKVLKLILIEAVWLLPVMLYFSFVFLEIVKTLKISC